METFWLRKSGVKFVLGTGPMSEERAVCYIVENPTNELIHTEIAGKERLVLCRSFLIINPCGREETLGMQYREQFGELLDSDSAFPDLPRTEVEQHLRHPKGERRLTAGWATSKRRMHTFRPFGSMMLFDPVTLRGRFISEGDYRRCWQGAENIPPLPRDVHLALFNDFA